MRGCRSPSPEAPACASCIAKGTRRSTATPSPSVATTDCSSTSGRSIRHPSLPTRCCWWHDSNWIASSSPRLSEGRAAARHVDRSMTAGHGFVHRQLDGDVLVLRLNRPPAHAFTTELLADLDAAVRDAGEDGAVRCVVLTGSGSFFSGGFDMKAPPRGAAEALEMANLYHA